MRTPSYTVSDVFDEGEACGYYSCSVNGSELELPEGIEIESVLDNIRKEYDSISACPYCGTKLLSVSQACLATKSVFRARFEQLKPLTPDRAFGGSCNLKWCEHCRFWLMYSHRIERPNSSFQRWHWSNLREFNRTMPNACADEIAVYLRRHPKFFHCINPHQLERFVADVWKANYLGAEVFHVGRSGDQGVDVIYVDASGQDWLIQVKRRANDRRGEGFKTVQNLAGTLALKQKLGGIVVTTADHFTASAYEAAHRLGQFRYTINLIDKGKLNRMLDPLLPEFPWSNSAADDNPEIVEFLNRSVQCARLSTDHTQTKFESM